MARINTVDRRNPTLGAGAVRIVGGAFVESDGSAAGTYNLDVFIPAYAVILDVICFTNVVFGAGTSAVLDVGTWSVDSGVIDTVIDVDDIFDAVNVKATDLVHGESISLNFAGGKHGNMAGVVATQDAMIDQVDIVDRFVKFQLVTVGTVATTGRVYTYIVYGVPEMDPVTFTAT